MNSKEYLLTQLAEECSEVAKEASKANRFGIDDVYPNRPYLGTNRDRIVNEINDVLALVEMLQSRGVLPRKIKSRRKIEQKKLKVARFMRYAKRKGTLK